MLTNTPLECMLSAHRAEHEDYRMRLARIALAVLLGIVLVSTVACSSEHLLQIHIDGGQGEIYPSSGKYYYPAGTLVTVVATPDDGWEFSHFHQADLEKAGNPIIGDNYSNPILVTLDGDRYIGVVFTEVLTPTSYGKPCEEGLYNGIYGTDSECHVCPSSCSAPAGAENVSGEGFSVGAGVCCYWVNCSPYECQTTE